MKLCIIIPAYNEEKRIGRTLEAYCNYFSEKKKRKEIEDFEILVVINNTTDRTEEIVKFYQKKCKELKYLNFKQGGKGFAVIEGFKEALKDKKNSFIGFVDADLATTPEAYYDLIENINGYEGIIASRYLKGAIVKPKPSIQRIIASRVFNFLIKALFFLPYKDTQCGAKIFKRNAIERVLPRLSMSQWAFDVDLLYGMKKRNYKIKEIPTIWSDKEYSKINLVRAGPRMVLALIRLRLINSPFRWLVSAYNRVINFICYFR